jgi:RNA polymerase sigma-70 factor (ECF subfamily)
MRGFSHWPASSAPEPFEALLRPHLQRLYRLAYRLTGSRDDAEDLVQSLLVKLVRQEQRLAEVEALAPWLARALYHLYVDDVRRQTRTPTSHSAPETDAALVDALPDEGSETPEQAAERRWTNRRLTAALAELPVEQRALIAWHDLEGYSLSELASALDIPVGTLKSRLHRARAHLRRSLTEPPAAPERVYATRTFA